ncbi:hypothetical protein BYT27DRAFT_7116196, partial [Phlegmacium glaucopus]
LKPLQPEDIRASTAIVNPNEPGSTQLKLSWIWQTAGGHRLGLAASAIHWLRARAQLMRWQEEVTLTRYEMQWTVAFFSYSSHKWGMQLGSTAGAIAYAKHNQAMWHQFAIRADWTFSLLNDAYISPL